MEHITGKEKAEEIKELKKETFLTISGLYNYIRQWGIVQEDICAIIPSAYFLGICIDYILLYWESEE